MITANRVRALAREDDVTAGLAEKHYVNSWVLYAVFTGPLDSSLVFKGGTALSKLYFPELWRFSEDLDFTATEQLPRVEESMATSLTGIEAASGIDFEVANDHRAGDPVEYVQIDVQYDAVLGQKNTTQLDLTFDERLSFPVVGHEHAFEDVPAFDLWAYSVEEIFVEKLRSLFQRARARDYYDVYQLLEAESFEDAEIVTALREKSELHDVAIDLQNGVPTDDIESVRAYWERALHRLVTDELAFDTVVERIDAYLQRLATVEA